MSLPKLYLNRIAEFDWLIALEFGRVDDGQASDHWRGVTESFGFLLDSPGGSEVGFKIVDFSDFDPEHPEVAVIWSEPHFDVPLLGLTGASAGEIVTAARPLLGEGSTVNRWYFDAAVKAEGEEALSLWLACLQAGDSMAHFALGYTLYELGRHHEAYRHLRHYTEIAPAAAWNWCWLGKAAEAIGELTEARVAYERAIELSEDDDETDAPELLERLRGPGEMDTHPDPRFVTVSGRNGLVQFDLDRLRPKERELWHQTFPEGFVDGVDDPGEPPALRLYSFAHICNLAAFGCPAVITEWMEAIGADPAAYTKYLDNVRRARGR